VAFDWQQWESTHSRLWSQFGHNGAVGPRTGLDAPARNPAYQTCFAPCHVVLPALEGNLQRRDLALHQCESPVFLRRFEVVASDPAARFGTKALPRIAFIARKISRLDRRLRNLVTLRQVSPQVFRLRSALIGILATPGFSNLPESRAPPQTRCACAPANNRPLEELARAWCEAAATAPRLLLKSNHRRRTQSKACIRWATVQIGQTRGRRAVT
jgi:hypothetical protein